MSASLRTPHFSAHDAAEICQAHFGISGIARPLPSERDQNFQIIPATGPGYVLKLAQSGEDPALLECQNAVLSRLQAAQTQFRFPRLHSAEIVEIPGLDGQTHLARLVDYLPGSPLALVRPHSPALLGDVGRLLGRVDRALFSFEHPAAARELYWDLRHARAGIARNLARVSDAQRRVLIESFLPLLEVPPALDSVLRRSVIHNDGNDYNLIVQPPSSHDPFEPMLPVGLIDFGDLVFTWTLAEVAIGAAYAMLGQADPLAAAAAVVAGYHAELPIPEAELPALFPMICTRLCLSVVLAAAQRGEQPDNEYLSISEAPAWALLEVLRTVNADFAHYRLRAACGLEPVPHTGEVVSWLSDQLAGVLLPGHDLGKAPVLDFSVQSLQFGHIAHTQDPETWTTEVFGYMRSAGATAAIGRYDEARPWYTAPAFESAGLERSEWRTVHIGIDVFAAAGTRVSTPLAGVVHSVHDNAGPLDYGPTIILRHDADRGSGIEDRGVNFGFYTLYGHLSRESLGMVEVGAAVSAGQVIATLGDAAVNGGWAPHLHFQLITDLLGRAHEFPGVARPSERALWLSLSPDPNLLLRLPQLAPAPPLATDALRAQRAERIGPSLSVAYRKPLAIVRGWMQHLYDQDGQAYLDAVNNVAHVGHSHPRVVAALRQAAVLNTNTRYLHERILEYAKRLSATLPESLSVCYFVNSGSEANELALRLARAHTHAHDVIVIDSAYHGNTSALIDLSPYKFDGAGGGGRPAHVQVVPLPDPYRGLYRGADSGAQYARHVQDAVAAVQSRCERVAALFAEPLLGCGGQIVPPAGYLRAAFEQVRAAGGVCVADEVQTGLGRAGSHFWAFQTQGVQPDIVTVGKPIGNGHPLGAVITTPAIAASFNNGMEYFNTFGGNPVSCAVGLAVLDVIADEGLQENALRVGDSLMRQLTELQTRHPIIGDVRGRGLYIGVELVSDPLLRVPAGAAASYVANRLRERGVLLSTDGPDHNVLKIKPPLVFGAADASLLVEVLDSVLGEDAVRIS